MALPDTLSGITFSRAEYGGPFRSSGGDFYFVSRAIISNVISVFKNDHPGTNSWVAQDVANDPDVTPLYIHCYQVGDTLHIASADSIDPYYHYHTFSMSSDTWGITDEDLGTSIDDVPHEWMCAITVRSDGDVIVLYNGDTDKVHGAEYDRVDYARRESSSWTTNILISGTGQADWYTGSAILGSNDRVHFTYNNQIDEDAYQRTLVHTGNAVETMPSPGDLDAYLASPRIFGPVGITYNDGTQRVRACYVDADQTLSVAEFDSEDAPGAFTPVTGVISDPIDFSTGQALCLMLVDGTDQYVVYVDETTDDLLYDNNTGSGWGDSPNQMWIGTVTEFLGANIYLNYDGAKVIGFIVFHSGVAYYHEEVLEAAPSAVLRDIIMGPGIIPWAR